MKFVDCKDCRVSVNLIDATPFWNIKKIGSPQFICKLCAKKTKWKNIDDDGELFAFLSGFRRQTSEESSAVYETEDTSPFLPSSDQS
jgi:hypothetical protein